MTSIKEEDYKHSNECGNGPAKRMTGGDLTDDIQINDPNFPVKTPKSTGRGAPKPETEYEKPK